MPDSQQTSLDPQALPGGGADIFLEDVEQSFSWRQVPLEGWICIPIFWVLAGVVFWQFFTRYALDSAAVWTEEVARQLFILLTFFGAGYALRTRAHICINFFLLMLPEKAQRFVGEISALLQLVFYSYSIYLCLLIAKATVYQRLMSIDVSKSYVYYAVSVAFAIMAVRSVLEMVAIYRGRRAQIAGVPGLAPGNTHTGGLGQ